MRHTVEASRISAASLGKEHRAPSIVLKKEVEWHTQISPTSKQENVPFWLVDENEYGICFSLLFLYFC